MRLILDTHYLLWSMEDSPELPARIRALLADRENEIFISIASLWEIAIKISLGKLNLSGKSISDLTQFLEQAETTILPVLPSHLTVVEQMPWHHRDPFDRLIVAQAQVEGLRLVSADKVVALYLPDVIA
ncbi:MAG: type II toxin-antitoxin system VapC family toxin [Acidobacteriaceae bacterium]|nr:type II toxin-antitoxin system VapC family toxin [Acidobacteriaceae bacterium]